MEIVKPAQLEPSSAQILAQHAQSIPLAIQLELLRLVQIAQHVPHAMQQLVLALLVLQHLDWSMEVALAALLEPTPQEEISHALNVPMAASTVTTLEFALIAKQVSVLP